MSTLSQQKEVGGLMMITQQLPEDLVVEILLHVPPDDPAHLFRASLVCKSWRRLLTDPAFHFRYRTFHRTPPLLGFFHHSEPNQVQFIPTMSFRPRKPNRNDHVILDCRHGRVLLFDMSAETSDFIVWDPITDEEQRVPPGKDIRYLQKCVQTDGAVLCATADCDHGDCHGGPFFVVLLVIDQDDDEDGWFPRGCVYSSETGEWSAPYYSSMGFQHDHWLFKFEKPSALIGDVLHFISKDGSLIMRFDFRGEGGLSVTKGLRENNELAFLASRVDGDMRLAGLVGGRLGLWSRETMDADGGARWTQLAVIHLNTLPLIAASRGLPYLIGSAKDGDSDVFFVSTHVDIFAIELESHKVKKMWTNMDGCYGNFLHNFFPYASFITPGNHPPRS